MKKSKATPGNDDRLRQEAEGRLLASAGPPAAGGNDIVPDIQRLVHQLQVHQVELELQNEELRRTRAEAEDGRARYSDLYELAPVGYLSLGRDGVIREMNLTGARLVGTERSRLIGRRLAVMVAAEDLPAFNTFLEDVFEHGTKRAHVAVLRPEGAAPITVELVAVASEDGQACRVTVTDISRRRQAEQEREELQIQLNHAQKMEAIGTLAGGIAHDFNNILTGIMGGLSLLDLDLGEASEHHPTILEMTALVERGADLTKQLLGFARRGKYDVKPLDLARVVEKTSTMFGRTRRDLSCQLDAAPGLRWVLMDHSQFEQVLLNLLVNASQAMPTGGQVFLCAKNAEVSREQAAPHGVRPGHFVSLSVRDTGVGMDAATKARIFEPFFTTKAPGEGTGLGLASVYGIVKNHSGFVTVESELRRGTTISLFLPATDRPIATEKPVAASVQHGTGTILVVDDEETIVRVQCRLLERIGYKVLTASGGREALELVRQYGSSISLVILDMIMPDMSGRQAYEAMRVMAPNIKVLLSSGYSLDGQAQEILDCGCNGFVQKPFSFAALSTKLKELL